MKIIKNFLKINLGAVEQICKYINIHSVKQIKNHHYYIYEIGETQYLLVQIGDKQYSVFTDEGLNIETIAPTLEMVEPYDIFDLSSIEVVEQAIVKKLWSEFCK